MAYITNTSIQQRLGNATYVQLADDDGDNVADVAVVDEARLAAEGEVNSYLAHRYAVPIDVAVHTTLASLLASIALDLAEYRLRVRRPPVPDDARKRHAQAVQWLSSVAAGKIDLPADGVAASTSRGVGAATTGDDRLLSRDELSDF